MSSYGGISIRPRQGNRPLPDDSHEDRIRLDAEVVWRFKGPKESIAEVKEALAGHAEEIEPDLLFVGFGNSVGFFDLPHIGRIEVHSAKWTTKHFNWMLREVTQIASALPFSAAEGSALPYERNVPIDDEILYHAFVYLRHVVLEIDGDENIKTAYDLVLADPHRRLIREDRMVAPELATSVGAKALEELVCGAVRLHKAPPGCRAPVAVALNGNLPELVREDVAYRRLDCPENRFAKALLGQLLWIADLMHDKACGSDNAFRAHVAKDCKRIRRTLEPIARHSIWRGIGPMVAIPEASTVLQRRRGYRELFGCFAALRLASKVPLSFRDVQRLLDNKDIATLYELWCFFRVVEAIQQSEGAPKKAVSVRHDEWNADVKYGYRVVWRSGVTAAYNPSFSAKQDKRRSYSLTLRPDISVRLPAGPNRGLHLLDAKFKLDNLGELLDEHLEDDSEARGRSGVKNIDLYKMHTYRDAIPDARSVWVLYPGAETCFFDANLRPKCTAITDLPTEVVGVGGVPLRPEDDADEGLRELVGRLLDRSLKPHSRTKGE